MAIKVANNQSLTAITALPSAITAGAMTLLSTQTASSSATISFTSGIDDTYDEYIFMFNDIHPATNQVTLGFQGNVAGGADYNETITSTFFKAGLGEDDSGSGIGYETGADQANGTAFQQIIRYLGNDNDQSGVGYLHLFNPSSTTFVKHFISATNHSHASDETEQDFVAGYFNTTSAIDEIQFKMSSGNIDAGTFKMYGVS